MTPNRGEDEQGRDQPHRHVSPVRALSARRVDELRQLRVCPVQFLTYGVGVLHDLTADVVTQRVAVYTGCCQ